MNAPASLSRNICGRPAGHCRRIIVIVSLRLESSGVFPTELSISFRTAELLIALGLVLSTNRSAAATALRLRIAARRMSPAKPDYPNKALLVQLSVTAFGLAVIAASTPPVSPVEIARGVGLVAIAPVLWTGIFSIGAAAFGSNAHAAVGALFDEATTRRHTSTPEP